VSNLISLGVGSGATDFSGYDSYIKEVLKDQKIWRCLYEGYMGVDWKDTTVESDDDWYFVTKVVVHCLVNDKSPKQLYKVADRLLQSDKEAGLTLESLQRKGQKILNEAEKLYNKAKNGTEQYRDAEVEIIKQGELYNSGEYIVQEYKINSNKELGSYDVNLRNFPTGTTYSKSGNIIKVKILKKNIKEDINGTIDIVNARVKTCPAFYAEAQNDNYQDYVIAADPYESTSARISLKIASNNATLKIVKTDEETGNKLENIKFNVKYENGENIGNFITDKNGEIYIENLKPCKVIITELETDEIHVLDTTEHNATLMYGETTEIKITNDKIKGRIKIIKTSEYDNPITGDKAGTPISNAEFEIYNENKELVDIIITGKDGSAITKELDKGIYIGKETKSGKWYVLNGNEFTAEIKEDGEIVEVNITNEPEKPSVDIEKNGLIQTTRNEEIRYDFHIKNTGNTKLDNFTWYDYLPTDYIKLTKLITGTYNQDLDYAIYYKTNKNDYRLLKNNLNTQVNNYIDFSNIKLKEGEYVTEFKVDFGTVDIGFESVIDPYIFTTVNDTVQNDDTFTNKTRIEGYNDTYLVWDEDNHTTKVYEKKLEVKKLPRTGF